MRARLASLVPAFRRFDPALYTAFAALVTLSSARKFYGYMLEQTGGEWSAPLDDVFIHFDYARSTARGYPFQWTVGNGYSSGNTSLSYPFVLAAGWLAGFREERLMVWAAIIAAICVFAVLLAARQLFFIGAEKKSSNDNVGRALSYLLPPMFLGIGALDWSLWSGMEVAFFLGTWAIALVAFLSLDAVVRVPDAHSTIARRAWLLGVAGALMVVTRPEGAGTLAAFGIACAISRRKYGISQSIGILARVAIPGVLILAAQTLANHELTGEWSANGAIVKLGINNPYWTLDEKIADYRFNFKYATLRNIDYHFADAWGFGFILPALALSTLAVKETRRIGLVIFAQIVMWQALIAFNGQVRWQNERYTMPAVAWMLVLAALGVTTLLRRRTRPNAMFIGIATALLIIMIIIWRPPNTPRPAYAVEIVIGAGVLVALVLRVWALRAAVVLLALFFADIHQAAKMQDQKWFFGRASRNIRDQHTTMGRWLAEKKPKRILVGDAGAILYAADRPGLDIIGLGGYHELPFARAGLAGLPMTIELIERMPPEDRPDVLAIFPTWWGVLPTWFSSEVLARFPVEGNVICGGYEHVAYRANWKLLNSGDKLRVMPEGGRRIVDEIDVADLVSEKEHAYVYPHPAGGWPDMRILPDPTNPHVDMFDGGRRIGGGRAETFTLAPYIPKRRAFLVLRTVPDGPTTIHVLVNGQKIADRAIEASEGWSEISIDIPDSVVTKTMQIEIDDEGPSDFVDFHGWLVQ